MFKTKLIVICGPTCSGKSELAISLAQQTQAVIINADSQQIYSDLPILSAMPTDSEMKLAPHYLYGTLTAPEVCNAVRWLDLAREAIKQTGDRRKIFVGGTGMYLGALFNGIAQIPEISEDVRRKVRDMPAEEVAKQLGDEADGNTQRMKRALEVKLSTGKSIKEWHKEQTPHEYSPQDFQIILKNVSRETLYERINQRFIWQMNNGALDEVKKLAAKNLHPEHPIMKALGVPEIIKYLNEEISYEDAVSKAQQKIRNFAKRQQTWFKHQLPEHKIDITGLNKEEINEAIFK